MFWRGQMKVLNEYPNSHHYWTEWKETKLFCPDCGKQNIWAETGPGDYYIGSDFACLKCGHFFYMLDSGREPKENDVVQLEQLCSGVTKEPITRKGR